MLRTSDFALVMKFKTYVKRVILKLDVPHIYGNKITILMHTFYTLPEFLAGYVRICFDPNTNQCKNRIEKYPT